MLSGRTSTAACKSSRVCMQQRPPVRPFFISVKHASSYRRAQRRSWCRAADPSQQQQGGGGGDGSNMGRKGDGGNPPQGPHTYPAWLKAWIWATVAMYLLARTKWRLDRWQVKQEQEKEAAMQAQQDAEWQRFVEDYAARDTTTSGSVQQPTRNK